jgi:flagellar hook-associated protein 3 FlgL
MRITGARLMTLEMAATAAHQEHLADAAEQVSSGKRVDVPSDDPIAWASAQRANLRKQVLAGHTAALESTRDRLAETDGALATIGDAVSQARSLAIQGANASYGPAERKALGVQVRSLFEGALRAANSQNSDGEYLLAGYGSMTQPFSATGAYVGDANTRVVSGSIAGVSGAALTAPNGVDVLPLLSRVADALDSNDETALAAAIGELNTATQQVSLARSHGGAASSVLESTLTAHAQLDDTLTQEIARHVEVDAIAAATELAKTSQALEASRLVAQHIATLLDPRNMGL